MDEIEEWEKRSDEWRKETERMQAVRAAASNAESECLTVIQKLYEYDKVIRELVEVKSKAVRAADDARRIRREAYGL